VNPVSGPIFPLCRTARPRAPVCLIALACVWSLCASAQGAERDGSHPRLTLGYGHGLVTGVSEADGKATLHTWAEAVSKLMPHRHEFEGMLFTDGSSMLAAVKEGRVDMVAMLSTDYLRAERDAGLTPALVLTAGGRATEDYVLLVHEGSSIRRVDQLQNARVMVPLGAVGDVGLLWADCLLVRRGLPASEHWFRSVGEAKDASRAVLSVFFREADACVVTKTAFATMQELNPQLRQSVRTLATSPPLLVLLICFTPSADEQERRDIVSAALRLHESPHGRQILTLVKKEKAVRFRSSDLEAVAALVRERDAARERDR